MDSCKRDLVTEWWGLAVSCIEFSPDDNGLISVSGDGTVECWDMTSLESGPEKSFKEVREF